MIFFLSYQSVYLFILFFIPASLIKTDSNNDDALEKIRFLQKEFNFDIQEIAAHRKYLGQVKEIIKTMAEKLNKLKNKTEQLINDQI